MLIVCAVTVPFEPAWPITVTFWFGARSAVVPWVVRLMRAFEASTFTSLLVVRSWTVIVLPSTAVIAPAAAGVRPPPAPPPKPPPPVPPAAAPPAAWVAAAGVGVVVGWPWPYLAP